MGERFRLSTGKRACGLSPPPRLDSWWFVNWVGNEHPHPISSSSLLSPVSCLQLAMQGQVIFFLLLQLIERRLLICQTEFLNDLLQEVLKEEELFLKIYIIYYPSG